MVQIQIDMSEMPSDFFIRVSLSTSTDLLLHELVIVQNGPLIFPRILDIPIISKDLVRLTNLIM